MAMASAFVAAGTSSRCVCWRMMGSCANLLYAPAVVVPMMTCSLPNNAFCKSRLTCCLNCVRRRSAKKRSMLGTSKIPPDARRNPDRIAAKSFSSNAVSFIATSERKSPPALPSAMSCAKLYASVRRPAPSCPTKITCRLRESESRPSRSRRRSVR